MDRRLRDILTFFIVAWGGGLVTFLIIMSAVMALFFTPGLVLGGWLYVIGWLITRHGYQIGPVSINLFSVWIISIAFSLYVGARWAIKKTKNPVRALTSIAMFSIIIIVVAVLWSLFGHGLIYVSEEWFGVVPQVVMDHWFLGPLVRLYHQFDVWIDGLLIAPTLIYLYIVFMREYYANRDKSKC